METTAQYRYAQQIPWRLPFGLIVALLIALTALAWSPSRPADNDPQVNPSLAVLSATCALEGGHLEHSYGLNQVASVHAINSACSVKGGQICAVGFDDDFACALVPPVRQTETTLSPAVVHDRG